jgi:hypothetical protein
MKHIVIEKCFDSKGYEHCPYAEPRWTAVLCVYPNKTGLHLCIPDGIPKECPLENYEPPRKPEEL